MSNTEAPTRNTDLFNDIADKVENEPEAYDQSTWLEPSKNECGSRGCIAGWAVALSGDAVHNSDGTLRGGVKSRYIDLADGRSQFIQEVIPFDIFARESLGLSGDEANHLFAGTWKPKSWLGVPGALRALGRGASIEDVTA